MKPTPTIPKPLAERLLEGIWTDTYRFAVQTGISRFNPDDLAAFQARAKSIVVANRTRPFNPEESPADAAFQQRLDCCKAQLEQLRSSRRIRVARVNGIGQQTAPIKEPVDARRPILITGTAALTLAFAPTIHAVFLANTDPVLGWVSALGLGGLIGAYLMFNLLADEECL